VNGLFIASSSALDSAPAVLTPLVASVILLSIRAWSGATGAPLTRRVALLLDGVIVVVLVLFIILVYVRFRTLG
jgi:hypothetical protein